jgi:hypothetical protein
MRSETKHFGENTEWNSAFLWTKPFVQENLKLIQNFYKFWTLALSIIEWCQKNVEKEQ